MLDKKLLAELLECHSDEEIYNLLKNVEFPESDGSKFSDDVLRFKTSTGEFCNVHTNLEGIKKLVLKILLLFKLHGHMGSIPIKSGIRVYMTVLAKVIRDLFPNNCERLDVVTPNNFEEFQKKRIKEVCPQTIKTDILHIHYWIFYANPLLPHILKIDERLVNNNKTIFDILDNASVKQKDYVNGVGGSSHRIFPLSDTKKIMKSALDYIENFSDEIQIIAKIYIDRKTKINDYQERKFIVDYFKDSIYKFEEPTLRKLQIDSIHNKIMNVRSPAKTILNCIRLLEGACIFVSLSLTGCRASEFVKIKRFPEFRQEEHLYLTRIVTKTSLENEGENIEMPVPLSVKKAIEIISNLTSLLDDGKKSGKLLMNSWENLKICNVITASQRLSLAIKYFCTRNNLPAPTPHMTRHTMAFIIVYFSEGDSIELARLFLGHKSITMTLRYLGHYNEVYKKAINVYEMKDAKYNAKQISNEIRYGNKLYGINGEKIMNAQFTGMYVEEFADLLEVGLIEMTKLSKYIILNTPYCYCIHDKSTTDSMPCQQGINFNEIKKYNEFSPLTGQCKPASCGNAVFTEKDISSLQANQLLVSIPDEFKERISKNIYFINDNSFDELDTPLKKIIEQYNYDKKTNKGA